MNPKRTPEILQAIAGLLVLLQLSVMTADGDETRKKARRKKSVDAAETEAAAGSESRLKRSRKPPEEAAEVESIANAAPKKGFRASMARAVNRLRRRGPAEPAEQTEEPSEIKPSIVRRRKPANGAVDSVPGVVTLRSINRMRRQPATDDLPEARIAPVSSGMRNRKKSYDDYGTGSLGAFPSQANTEEISMEVDGDLQRNSRRSVSRWTTPATEGQYGSIPGDGGSGYLSAASALNVAGPSGYDSVSAADNRRRGYISVSAVLNVADSSGYDSVSAADIRRGGYISASAALNVADSSGYDSVFIPAPPSPRTSSSSE